MSTLTLEINDDSVLKQIITILNTFSSVKILSSSTSTDATTPKEEFLNDFEEAIITAKGIQDGTVDTTGFNTLDGLIEGCKKEDNSV
jgi:hypothetical protein